MIAEFSINPTDSVHISRDLARLVEILEGSGLHHLPRHTPRTRISPGGSGGDCTRS